MRIPKYITVTKRYNIAKWAQNNTRDLILGDAALRYVAYVTLIWAPLIPTTRWSHNQPLAILIVMTADWSST